MELKTGDCPLSYTPRVAAKPSPNGFLRRFFHTGSWGGPRAMGLPKPLADEE